MTTKSGSKKSASKMARGNERNATARDESAKRKTARKRQRRRELDSHVERNGAHAYAERVPIMADELADRGGSATVKELYTALSTGKAGLFGTERRVAATFRHDQRQESPVFERADGNAIKLRKQTRVAASKRKISRKRTRNES